MTEPRRNRVDPFGRIHAVAARGLLMGNRGILHDDQGRVVRSHVGKAWISCNPSVPGPKRPLADPGSYTVLFFLDEATALSAGHRPCFTCRRDEARQFRDLYATHFNTSTANAIDMILHAERRDRSPIKLPDDPPVGVMVATAKSAWLKVDNGWRRWTFAGYEEGEPPSDAVLLTPPSIVAVLAAGYRPILHPSASS